MPTDFAPADPARFEAALRRFREENSRDPNTEIVNGTPRPRELVHAQWLSDWVLRLRPNAGEPLRLAAACQHLRRWHIPREQYPMDRPGYLQWRSDLKKFHARAAGEILRATGYDDDTVRRVEELNLKRNFPNDPDGRVLEDALCLVFLERQLAALAAKTDEAKVINALQKSWKKMTPDARAEALKLNLGERERELIRRALG